MQTDTGTIQRLDETRSRRAPRAVLAGLAAAAVLAAVAIAVPASLDETPRGPVVEPITVNTSLPAIGLSHVPTRGSLPAIGFSHVRPMGPLPSQHAHGPLHVPKQGALGDGGN